MVNNVPPPPPPPPGGFRGGPGQGAGPQIHPQQQPQHQQPQFQPQQFHSQPNHAMGFPPSQLPIRTQSHRISNIQTQRPMDETACLKELTTYKAYTLQKIPPLDPREKASWARVDVQEERLAQEDLIKAIDKLKPDKHDKHTKSVAEKKLALAPNQSTQVTNILDDLAARERDQNYEWTLSQMDSKTSKKNGVKQTDAMTIYFKRAPVKGSNVMSLYQQNIERQVQREQQEKRQEHERRQREQYVREMQMREQQQMREHQMREQQAHAQQQQNNNRGGQGPQIITLGNDKGQRGRSKNRARSKSREKRHKSKNNRKTDKHYPSDSDSYDSDSSWSSSDMSSHGTTISSHRDRGSDKHHKKDKHSGRRAPRSHRKQYYNIEVPRSPRAVMQDRFAVPEVPRSTVGFDQVEAAYQAGLQDADDEHYAMRQLKADSQLIARERQAAYERVPRSLPLLREEVLLPRTIVERPVPLDRSLPRRLSGARAMVSYGAEEDLHRPPLPPRVYSESSRYIDGRRDARDYIDDERMLRQERRAHEHMDSRRAEPNIGRRTSFYRRSSAYEPVIHQGHPFAPHTVRDDRFY